MRAKGEAGLRSKEGGGVELQGEGPAFVSSRERKSSSRLDHEGGVVLRVRGQSLFLLDYRWPMTAQRPARRAKRRRTTRETARTRRGCPSSSSLRPRQEDRRMLWEKRTQLRKPSCAPVNKRCSPVRVVFVCCQPS